MNVTEINRKIKVGAVFEKGFIVPKWFILENRKQDVGKVTYRWKSRAGEADISHFSVTGGANLYELTFNHKTLEWNLENVAFE